MRIGLGVIGCGRHAAYHVAAGQEFFGVLGGWDPNPAAAKALSGVAAFPSIDDLLAHPQITAVFIGSPDQFHVDQMRAALLAGKHVMCEKPMVVPRKGGGAEIDDLLALCDLARERKLVLTSCHPRRFDWPFVWFKELWPKHRRLEIPQRFGKVVSVDFDFSYHKPSLEWKHGRSLMFDHLSHEIDLLNMLFGIKPFVVWKMYDSHDRYEVAGMRDDLIAFHFRGTRRLSASVYPEWCRVRFEHCEVELDMLRGVAVIKDHETKQVAEKSDLAIDYNGRLTGVMRAFAKEIRGEKGYLSRSELIMNAEAPLKLWYSMGDAVRVHVRN